MAAERDHDFLKCLPDHVLILGGGRWARVLAEVLCDLLPASVELAVCSPRGAEGLNTWIRERSISRRLQVLDVRPSRLSQRRTAVIVANAARDHVAAGHWALGQGAAVLVEKPLALSLGDAHGLCAKAVDQGGFLAAAHVFRFARYLEVFARHVAVAEEIQSIAVEWSDPAGEARYGERKQYDAGVPVYADCLPHIVSILQTVFADFPRAGGPVEVEAGGGRMRIPLTLAGRPCRVFLERKALRRRRAIIVETGQGTLELDFSTEPGVIRDCAMTLSADVTWSTALRPLPSLLKAFLVAACGGPIDPRLSLDTALQACDLIETTATSYQAAVLPWVVETLAAGASVDDNLRYALNELLQADGPLSAEVLETQIVRLRTRFEAPHPGTELSALSSLIRAYAKDGLYA